jgi:DNA-binding beta-propeller fold protein YncE
VTSPLALALLATVTSLPGWGPPISLPGGPPVGMDYLAYDASTNRVWVPAGNTGDVDVIDAATGKVSVIGGLPTAPPRRPGRPRVGPSSAAVAGDVVWIGNRADDRLSSFDARTLAPRASLALPTMPDGLQYVARTRELWVTAPGARAILIVPLAGKAPGPVATLALEGAPEGYAVDDTRGVFYTNLEDKDETLALDVRTRKVIGRWPAGCGGDGPRGLALDEKRGWLFVACTNGARVLSLPSGKQVGHVVTGGGVDNLAYDPTPTPTPTRPALYIASAKDGTLVKASVLGDGKLHASSPVPTAPGARNPIVDARGTVYLEDREGGKLLVLRPDDVAR